MDGGTRVPKERGKQKQIQERNRGYKSKREIENTHPRERKRKIDSKEKMNPRKKERKNNKRHKVQERSPKERDEEFIYAYEREREEMESVRTSKLIRRKRRKKEIPLWMNKEALVYIYICV